MSDLNWRGRLRGRGYHAAVINNLRFAILICMFCMQIVSGCGVDETTTTTETGTSTGGCDNPILELTNMTGNPIEVVHFTACDMSDGNDFPLPPPGLAQGASTTIEFPGPGCWVLDYEGDGCTLSEPKMMAELDCGDTHVWVADEDHHMCGG